MTAFFRLVMAFSALVVSQVTAFDAAGAELTRWFQRTPSPVVFVFIHGVLSDSDGGWAHPDGTYWPKLLAEDKNFGNPSIYLGGYSTHLSGGNYSIEDAAQFVFAHLNGTGPNGEEPVLAKEEIIFVAHSMGGLVARQMLVSNTDAFRGKKIGLMLLASPSRGSEWADRANALSSFLNNRMLSQLQSNSEYVVNLDKQFNELLARHRIWMIAGMDVFENRFIIPGVLWNNTVVVNPDASRYYFGQPRLVADSDHFSIAKPSRNTGRQQDYSPHEFLWEFYEQRFKPEIQALSKCLLPKITEQPGKAALTRHAGLDHLRLAATPASVVLAQAGGATADGDAQKVCELGKLAELRATQPVSVEGGVRCEGGGLAARGDNQKSEVAFTAPPGTRIIGAVTVTHTSNNRGKADAVKYETKGDQTVGFKIPIECNSPSQVFGPGAWIQIVASARIERILTPAEEAKVKSDCGG